MREVKLELDLAKQRIQRLLGKPLFISINKGRNKIISFNGVITEAYPSIFFVKSDENDVVYSQSYTDILTKNILFFMPKENI